MRNLIKFASLSLMLLLVTSATAFAQKNKKGKIVEEGHVTYKISADGQMGMMLNGSTMDLYFAPDHARVNMDMASGMIKMDIRVDNKKKEGVMLMDMMGQRKAAKMTEEDLAKQEEDNVNKKPQKAEYKNNYKKIAGYKCQEVHVTMDGVDEPAIVYVTEKIKPAHADKLAAMQFQNLKGFPLSWTISVQGMKMTMEASEVSLSKVDKKNFDMKVPEGYQEMSLEDLEKMGGGTMGL